MRNSKVLARLRAGKKVRLAQLGFFVPPVVAYAAHAGYDGIWFDLEHRPMEAREVQAMLAFFHLYNIDCILRTATREKALLYRYLEDGAAGLIIPHVNDAEAARSLVQSVKFPPIGDRGVEGNGLETNFGLDITSRDQIAVHANRETFLMLQIETPVALAQIGEIAAVKGIDALYFGPADYALRVPFVPEGEQITHVPAMQRIAAACEANGLPWGAMPQTLDDIREHLSLGAHIHVWGSDLRSIRAGIAQASKDLAALLGD